MKIYHDLEQKSPEWHAVRSRNFTASELDTWVLEPLVVNLTVDQIKAKIDAEGLNRKGFTKRDELLEILSYAGFSPDPELCEGARTAILRKIKQERFAAMMARNYGSLTAEESIWLDRERELAKQSETQFEYNIPVKYGNKLEPYARAWYEDATGCDVAEVGFVEHDDGGFGCSPDGLIECTVIDNAMYEEYTHGLEIKCPVPETHLAWLMDGGMPEKHNIQVHASMAATGLNRWDFISYCPGEKPFTITVLRSNFTERVLAGLKIMVAEKAKMKAKLAAMWEEGA